MKNKKSQKESRPVHLHIEYLFRHQIVLGAMLTLLFVGIIRADIKMISIMRDAYVQGFGTVGQYLREETTRSAESTSIGVRMPTISGV
jgi:hypothetical protein